MQFAGGTVVPASSQHAVQAAVFVWEFAAHLSYETMQSALQFYEQSTVLKELFPKKRESKGVAIALGPKGVGVNKDSGLELISIERISPSGTVEISIQIQPSQISFSCTRYTRWKQVSQQAFGLLKEFSHLLLPAPGVAVAGLQYVDEFIATGDLNAFRPKSVFSDSGGLLPSRFLDQAGAWHSHLGWFENDQGRERKILNNLNVSAVLQQARLVIQMVTAHRHFLSRPVTAPDDIPSVLEVGFEELHVMNKRVLGQLLNQDARDAIRLNAEE